ncbi:TetR/AcrR family transcriptional regulator [Candidatus Bipolaricaulota bacterium]
MPRAFTAVEKETIRSRLMAAGRTCFLRYGLKKTTIEDLVKPAGVAKASFYLFFASKEDLYVELFLQEMPAMIDRLLDVSFRSTSDMREALVRLMKAIVHEIETNEMSRILLDDPSELQRLADALKYDEILARSAASFAPIIEAIAEAQARGEIIEGDPFQITYSLGLVKLLPVNRDRIPAELYDAMIDFAPRIIADGLTCPARKGT